MKFLQEMIAKKRAQHGLQDAPAAAGDAAASWSAPRATPTPVPPRRPEPPADWAASADDDAAEGNEIYDDESYDWDLEGEELQSPAGTAQEPSRDRPFGAVASVAVDGEDEESDFGASLVLRDVVAKSRTEAPAGADMAGQEPDGDDDGGDDAHAVLGTGDGIGDEREDEDGAGYGRDEDMAWEAFDDGADAPAANAAQAGDAFGAATGSGAARSSLEENIEKLRVQRKIWDMEEDVEEDPEAPTPAAAAPAATPLRLDREERVDMPAPAPAPAATPAAEAAPAAPQPRRAGRVKTRLLGFHKGDETISDPFAAAAGPAPAPQGEPQFPVGWMVVVGGPGRGASFTLTAGASRIGRGEDQAIRLDFGDTSISRDNHAAVAYDDEQRCFYIGHGGKANLVRLNDMPVLSTEALNDGDMIRIGETTLMFIALCGPEFSWQDEGDGDGRYAAAE